MSERPKVLLIVTLDTKAREAAYVREILESQGVEVVHLDASIRRVVDGGAEIGTEAVARAAGSTLEDVRALKHEGKCQAVMTAGALELAVRLQADGQIAGVLGIGGSMGTTLALAALILTPLAISDWPTRSPTTGALSALVGLALLCSALAFVLMAKLIGEIATAKQRQAFTAKLAAQAKSAKVKAAR